MNIADTISRSKSYLMDLAIDQVGSLDIVVRSGSLTLDGAAKSLASDETFTVTNRAEKATLMGYLVEDTTDGSIHTLIDEVIDNGVDDVYVFNRGDQYKLIAYLYRVVVPSNTSDLTNVAFTRYRIIAPE